MQNQKQKKLDQSGTNRQTAEFIGDVVSMLYEEVNPLPMSDLAKHVSVMVIVGDQMTRKGHTITYHFSQ